MIQLRKISKSFRHLSVLNDLNLSFEDAGISAILGPNGSGKTTMIKCLLGMVLPNHGDILINEQNISRQWAYRDQISYLPQIARFPENLSVGELIRMLRSLRNRSSQEDTLIQIFGLESFMDKKLGHLSGGTRQKVNLVQAFMYDNPILILDEPTAGLDPVAVLKLKDLLNKEREKGKIILITTHLIPFVEEMADEIVFLMDGKIHFRGSPSHLRKQYEAETLETAIAQMLQNQQFVSTPVLTPVNGEARSSPNLIMVNQ